MYKECQPGSFYGEPLVDRQLTGFRMVERIYTPEFKTRKHAHAEAYFCLILEGVSCQTYGTKSRTRLPLSMLFYPPGEIQSETFGNTGGRIFTVEIGQELLVRLGKHPIKEGESFSHQNGLLPSLATKLYQEFRATDEAALLVMEGLAFEILGHSARQCLTSSGQIPPPWLARAKEILHSHFPHSIPLAALAELVGVHPVHLASMFRKYYHCSAGDYLRQLRVEYACRELAGDVPLVEIALAAGFSNQAHFCRIFKQFTGLTPAQFRANSR
jgi:AraC family transcriptional regulator